MNEIRIKLNWNQIKSRVCESESVLNRKSILSPSVECSGVNIFALMKLWRTHVHKVVKIWEYNCNSYIHIHRHKWEKDRKQDCNSLFWCNVFNKQRASKKKKKTEQKLNSTSAGNILLMFHSLSLIHTHIKNSFIPFMHLQATMQPDILQSESEWV